MTPQIREEQDSRCKAPTRETSMVVNRSAPIGTVVPVLIYEDADKAIDWAIRHLPRCDRDISTR